MQYSPKSQVNYFNSHLQINLNFSFLPINTQYESPVFGDDGKIAICFYFILPILNLTMEIWLFLLITLAICFYLSIL